MFNSDSTMSLVVR